MTALITGLDLGGAHLKAAQVTPSGRVVARAADPCALWQGLDRLEAALAEAAAVSSRGGPVAVTMTGELADLFPDRRAGVAGTARDAGRGLARAPSSPSGPGRAGFVPPRLRRRARARSPRPTGWPPPPWPPGGSGEGLLVDLGSTTTDIVVLAGGAVRGPGRSPTASGWPRASWSMPA